MKFNKSSQLLLVSAASLLAAVLITACGTATVDFVFVTSAKAAGTNNYGEIDVFEINGVSGAMRQIPSSPFPSGGRNPVAEAVSSDSTMLYVVNQDDNTIVQFLIGNDGKLYPQNTVNTPGIYPLTVAVSGTNLFVLDTYEPLPACSTAAPCPGSVGVFPLLPATTGTNPTPAGAPGTPVTNTSIGGPYWPLILPSSPTDVIVPTAISVLKSGADLFVTAYDSSVTPNVGYVFGFSIGSGGALTPLNGGVPHNMGVGSHGLGIRPSAIASYTASNNGTYIYVTDSTNGIVASYSFAAGVLTLISDTPTGNQPSTIVVDPSYPYAYVANAVDGNVEAYSIASSGALTYLGGSATPVTYTAGIDPVAIGIDPSTKHFLFTANFTPDGVSGTVSDFELSSTAGTLVDTQNSPYTSNANPTAIAAVAHGSTTQ
ncbi:MAG: beta-propeller fold lactonase family protein [Terracidiphilus sp.]